MSKKIPLFKVGMSTSAPSLVSKTLKSGYIGQGPKVEQFERMLKNYIGNDNLITTNSCTSSLHLALHMIKKMGVTTKDEILCPPLTCTATNWPVLANGFNIKWVDTDTRTLNMDLDDLENKITPRTRAVVIVHWGGYPVDLDRLDAILSDAERSWGFKPIVIEDAAHAYGSTYRGKRIGDHGNFTCFSFQAIKHLTTGDGGALTLPSNETYERAKLLRWYGIDRENNDRYEFNYDVPEYGFKFHMNDINASIGIENYRLALDNIREHRINSTFYDIELENVDGVTLLENKDDRNSSSWIYTILVEDRDNFKRMMDDAGIDVNRVHKRNDTFSATQKYRTELPNTDWVSERMISIPVGWWLSKKDRQYIVDKIKSGW